MRRHWLAIAVIITVAPACDNVSWGGGSMSLQTPSDRADTTVSEPPEPESPRPIEQSPSERVSALFAGARTGPGRAALVWVAEQRRGVVMPPATTAAGTSDDPFAKAHVELGAELVLFADGSRVGRLTVDDLGLDATACTPRPVVSGVVELVPTAAAADTFLALPAAEAGRRAFEAYQPLFHTYDQRIGMLSIARVQIPRVGALWPPSVLDARKDVRAFQLAGVDGPSVAATFLYGDTLAVARPLPRGYALFIMGTERPDGVQPDFVWYRAASEAGKGAPRYLDHLDWNGDGTDEVVLEVLGAEHRWFAGLAQRDGEWVRAFEDSCIEARPGS